MLLDLTCSFIVQSLDSQTIHGAERKPVGDTVLRVSHTLLLLLSICCLVLLLKVASAFLVINIFDNIKNTTFE